jgi:hypothetical protein
MVTRTTVVVVFCVVLLMMALPSIAGVNLTVWQETLTTLHAEWTWSPESASATGYNTSYWSGNLQMTRFGWDPSIYYWQIDWQFQHKIAPHEGDAAPGTLYQSSSTFAYSPQNANGTIIDQNGSVPHPASHKDDWVFTFYRGLDPTQSKIVLDVNHVVPEPSSLLALGAGTIGLLGLRRRKR